MGKKSYSYGMKLVGMIFHQFFTVLFTISMVLLGALFSRSMVDIVDIGENSFAKSAYYVSCVEKKYEQLSEYMHLTKQKEQLTKEERQRYLMEQSMFEAKDTNFTYWYVQDGILYTNDSNADRADWKFDADAVTDQVRKSGDYLIYDVENLQFESNIGGIDEYLFREYKGTAIINTEETLLIFHVDTSFHQEDDFLEAKREYDKLHPWVKLAIIAVILGMIGWVISLVYLTISAGWHEGEKNIRLRGIDRVKTEILVVVFLAFCVEIISLCARFVSGNWNISGLLVATGTISWVTDNLFLMFYLSMVRRIKAEVLWESSLACFLQKGLVKTFQERKITTRVLVLFAGHILIAGMLAFLGFYKRQYWCLLLLILFWAIECYIFLRKSVEHNQILQGVKKIAEGDLTYEIPIDELHAETRELGEEINKIGEGLYHAVDDSTKNERMKADLITNVSHDIKTPLTSIINYVNLIKLEDIQNEKVKGYIKILDEKSMRLKQLTEDLVEASKISSGNIKLDMQKIDMVELIYQTGGEFNEKFETKQLTIVTKLPKESVFVKADGRQLYRVIENLYNNAAKYALEKTRVYVEVLAKNEEIVFSIKNVSTKTLSMENAAVEDLTERFIRGDESRTTEGSGLGLSIAKNLTNLMGGTFTITVDGDIFKATIHFPLYTEE